MNDQPQINITGGTRPVPEQLTQPSHAETIPEGGTGDWADERCQAHGYHQPTPRYLEAHHVIPRAWQAAWRPPGETAVIWAPHTVLLCRSGHGNVHYWIERMMRQIAMHPTLDPMEASRTAMAEQHDVGRQEHVIARQGLVDFAAVGGNLAELAAAGVWGGLYGGVSIT